jgi:hypothetical protein
MDDHAEHRLRLGAFTQSMGKVSSHGTTDQGNAQSDETGTCKTLIITKG